MMATSTGSVLGSIAKDVGKGALGAIGGQAVTGLLSIFGLGGDSSSKQLDEISGKLDEIAGKLDRICGQLDQVNQHLDVLHDDLRRLHSDLMRIDQTIMRTSLLARMQTVDQELDDAESLIDLEYCRLADLRYLDPTDWQAEGRRIARRVIEERAIEASLSSIDRHFAGYGEADGGLDLVGQFYLAEAAARHSGVGLAPFEQAELIENAYAHLQSYFVKHVGVQLKGAVVLMNAYAVDQHLHEGSRAAKVDDVRDAVLERLRRQSERFKNVARDLALEDWPHEYFYWRDEIPHGLSDPAHFSKTSIVARSDQTADEVLGNDRHLTLRIFVTHCANPEEQSGISRVDSLKQKVAQEEALERDRERSIDVARSICAAIDKMPTESWWDAREFPSPDPPRLLAKTGWPDVSRRLLGLVFAPTAAVIVHRLPTSGFRAPPTSAEPSATDGLKGPEAILASYLGAIRDQVPADVSVRGDGRPLFADALLGAELPLDDLHHRPSGSVNVATYYPYRMVQSC